MELLQLKKKSNPITGLDRPKGFQEVCSQISREYFSLKNTKLKTNCNIL